MTSESPFSPTDKNPSFSIVSEKSIDYSSRIWLVYSVLSSSFYGVNPSMAKTPSKMSLSSVIS